MTGKYPIFDDHEWDNLACTIPLSRRQRDISHCLFRGFRDRQIAEELGLSISTIRTHLSMLFEKTGTQDRVDYILFLLQHFLNNFRQT